MTGTPASFSHDRLTLAEGVVGLRRREGGEGTIVFVHANGLNAGTYRPMLDAITSPSSIIAVDLRGHGRTTLPADPKTLRSWQRYADDLGEVVTALEIGGPLTLVGHSLGAVSLLLAARAGLTADRLVMIEPVIIPSTVRLIARTPLRRHVIECRGIAARAAGRRAVWPDRAAIEARYAATPFFAQWDEAALAGYLDDGLVAHGSGVALACDPAWEAATFAAQAHPFWRPLSEVASRLPTHVLRARGNSTVPDDKLIAIARAGARLTEMQGGHMLPAEQPVAVAAYLDMVLDGGGV